MDGTQEAHSNYVVNSTKTRNGYRNTHTSILLRRVKSIPDTCIWKDQKSIKEEILLRYCAKKKKEKYVKKMFFCQGH